MVHFDPDAPPPDLGQMKPKERLAWLEAREAHLAGGGTAPELDRQEDRQENCPERDNEDDAAIERAIVGADDAERATTLREMSPNELHKALELVCSSLLQVAQRNRKGLTSAEFSVLIQWMQHSVALSHRRMNLMRELSKEIPTMSYPKPAELMILALIENWFFETDQKVQTRLLEEIRKSVLEKAPERNKSGTDGVTVPGDDQAYHRPEWGNQLKEVAEKLK